jgi:hypothetical protein
LLPRLPRNPRQLLVSSSLNRFQTCQDEKCGLALWIESPAQAPLGIGIRGTTRLDT